jgi:hypothetical protein
MGSLPIANGTLFRQTAPLAAGYREVEKKPHRRSAGT